MQNTPQDAEAEDLWHVEVAEGDIKIVTLEQLDEAYEQGLITEDTRVWQEGMAAAVRLGDLLSGDGEDEEGDTVVEAASAQGGEAPALTTVATVTGQPEPQYDAVAAYQRAPQDTLMGLSAAQVQDLNAAHAQQIAANAPASGPVGAPAVGSYPPAVQAGASYPPPVSAPPPSAGSYPPAVQAGASYPPPVSAPPPSAGAAVGSYPPVVQASASYPPQVQAASYPPPVSAAASYPPPVAGATGGASFPPSVAATGQAPAQAVPTALQTPAAGPSIAPLAFDIPDDPMAFARPGRGKRIGVAVFGLAAVAAAVAVGVNMTGAKAEEPAAVPPVSAAAAAPFKSRAYQVGNEPLNLDSSGSAHQELTVRERSASDQESSAPSRKASKPVKSKQRKWRPPSKKSKSKVDFNGSKGKSSAYDPLNGSL